MPPPGRLLKFSEARRGGPDRAQEGVGLELDQNWTGHNIPFTLQELVKQLMRRRSTGEEDRETYVLERVRVKLERIAQSRSRNQGYTVLFWR